MLAISTAPRFGFAWAIGLYQTHLSPHKGFVCAHRVLHRGESCSQYAKRVVLSEGVRRAVMQTLGRFQDCKAAYQALLAKREERRESKWDYCELPLEVADGSGACDAGVLESLPAAECGVLDCAGACSL